MGRRAVEVAPLNEVQRRLADAELSMGWLEPEVWALSPPWLVRLRGREELHQEGRYAVSLAAASFDPVEHPGVPFVAYARQRVRWWFSRLRVVAATRCRVWAGMPATEEGDGLDSERPDHRRVEADPALRLWCSPDYAAQRKCLDWRSRLVLYLRAAEGYTLEECSGALGVSRERVRQLEEEAVRKLAAWRSRRRLDRQLAGRGVG